MGRVILSYYFIVACINSNISELSQVEIYPHFSKDDVASSPTSRAGPAAQVSSFVSCFGQPLIQTTPFLFYFLQSEDNNKTKQEYVGSTKAIPTFLLLFIFMMDWYITG